MGTKQILRELDEATQVFADPWPDPPEEDEDLGYEDEGYDEEDEESEDEDLEQLF